MKKGGRTHKLGGGGAFGNNPVSQQDMMMGKAAGAMKKGGRAKYATYGSVDELIKKNPPLPSKKANVPLPPERDRIADLIEKYGNTPPNRPMPNVDQMGNATGMKKGGRTHKHDDVKEDKALIKKMVKAEARTGRKHGGNVFAGDSKKKIPGVVGGRKAHADGGRSQADIDFQNAMLDPNTKVTDAFGKPLSDGTEGNRPTQASGTYTKSYNKPAPRTRMDNSYLTGPKASARITQPASGLTYEPPTHSEYGLFMGGEGEPAMKFSRQAPDADYSAMSSTPPSVPSWGKGWLPEPQARGGRTQHANGGRTKGTTFNVLFTSRGHEQGNMPNAPVNPPRPPQGIPVPPPAMAGGAPMGGAPAPQMPPQGMPPIGRKSGGRTGYPIDSGSGGGEARLEKIKAYGLTPPKRK
jgi:hypothetical protein